MSHDIANPSLKRRNRMLKKREIHALSHSISL